MMLVDVRRIDGPTAIPELGGAVLHGGYIVVIRQADGSDRVRMYSTLDGYDQWRRSLAGQRLAA